MTDARFPERWLNDRRILRLSDAAFRLFVTSLVWSVSNRTDGELDVADLDLLPRTDGDAAVELESAGLWKLDKGHWLICDYRSTQTTRDALDHLESIRRADREKKQRQRAVPRNVPGTDPGTVTGDCTGQDRLEDRTGKAGLEVKEVAVEVIKEPEPVSEPESKAVPDVSGLPELPLPPSRPSVRPTTAMLPDSVRDRALRARKATPCVKCLRDRGTVSANGMCRLCCAKAALKAG